MNRPVTPTFRRINQGSTPKELAAASLAGNVAVLTAVGLLIASAPTLAVLAAIAKAEGNPPR